MPDKYLYLLISLLQEQTVKRKAFNRQIQSELLNLHEHTSEKLLRQEYMRCLADRLIHLNMEIDQIINKIPVDLESLAG